MPFKTFALPNPILRLDKSPFLCSFVLQARMAATVSIPTDSPLICLLHNWALFKLDKLINLKRKKQIFYCNMAWPQYHLGDQETWSTSGTLNYNTILQLDLYCKRQRKWNLVPHVLVFMVLYQDPRLKGQC